MSFYRPRNKGNVFTLFVGFSQHAFGQRVCIQACTWVGGCVYRGVDRWCVDKGAYGQGCVDRESVWAGDVDRVRVWTGDVHSPHPRDSH